MSKSEKNLAKLLTREKFYHPQNSLVEVYLLLEIHLSTVPASIVKEVVNNLILQKTRLSQGAFSAELGIFRHFSRAILF